MKCCSPRSKVKGCYCRNLGSVSKEPRLTCGPKSRMVSSLSSFSQHARNCLQRVSLLSRLHFHTPLIVFSKHVSGFYPSHPPPDTGYAFNFSRDLPAEVIPRIKNLFYTGLMSLMLRASRLTPGAVALHSRAMHCRACMPGWWG